MRSKLLALYEDDEKFGIDAIDIQTGLMINPEKDVVEYLILQFPGRYEVYLNLFDEGEPPYRNILVSGKSKSLEVAKSIAVRKLRKKAYG